MTTRVVVDLFQGDSSSVLSVAPAVEDGEDAIVMDGNWECSTSVVDRNNVAVVAARAVSTKSDDDTAFLASLTKEETAEIPTAAPHRLYYWVVELRNDTLAPPYRVEHRVELKVKPQGIQV